MRLFTADIDARGQPVLIRGEQERAMLKNADLFFDGTIGGVEGCLSDEYTDGYVVLTNFRVIWVSYGASSTTAFDGVPCHLPLGSIAQTELTKAFLQLKPARIKLHVRLNSTGYPSSDALQVAAVSKLKIVIKSGGGSADKWHEQLQSAISRKAWTSAPSGLLQELHTPPRRQQQNTTGPMTPPPALMQQLTPSNSARPVTGGGHKVPSSADTGAGAVFVANPSMLAQLIAMGFGEHQAIEALRVTGNAGVEQAVARILADDGSSIPRNGGNSAQHPRHPIPLAPAAAAAVQQPARPNLQRNSLGAVGVAGIMKKEEKKLTENDRTLDEAFNSLNDLMSMAGKMVELAAIFRERAARNNNSSASTGTAPGGGEEEQIDEALAEELADLGITSPVTRETAGKLYFQELSRQLAAFIQAPVAAAGGMLPLPEVYRQFCRARFTDLLSPDDMLQAVRMFPDIGAPLRLREFPSGVKVIQAAGLDEIATCKKIAELAAAGVGVLSREESDIVEYEERAPPQPWIATLGPGVSRAEVAEALNVPLAVAWEHLVVAENKGMLCRDDGPEGVRFYKNFFASMTAA